MPHRIRFAAFFLSFLILASTSSSSLEDVKVIVYQGPKPSECTSPSTDKDNKPLKVESGHKVGIHFTVTIDPTTSNGTPNQKVESSHDRGIAPSFSVGNNKVIPGLDRGIVGLCKGSKAHIIIPPHLAYGDRGVPEQGVPGGATLRYDVEIIDIQLPAPNEFGQVDTNGDWKLSRKEADVYFKKKGQALDLDLLWKEEDKDGDGYISWDEFGGPKGDELPPHLEAQRKQQQQQRKLEEQQSQQKNEALIQAVALFESVAGEDEKISREELRQFFASVGQDLTDEFWRESDLDGDNFVSLVEWLGPEADSESKGSRQVSSEL